MKTLKKFLPAFGRLVVFAVVLVGALFLIPFVAGTPDFWDKNPEILVALVIGLAPSAMVLYVQNRKEERERHKWLLENRASALEEVVSVYGEVVVHGKMPDSPRKRQKFAELVKKMQKNKSRLIVWAPPSVIRALEYAEEAAHPGKCATHEELLGIIDDLFRTIRKELDHDDSALEKYELMGVFLVPESRKGLGLKGFDDR